LKTNSASGKQVMKMNLWTMPSFMEQVVLDLWMRMKFMEFSSTMDKVFGTKRVDSS